MNIPARLAFLTAQPFAHRGLHGGKIIENSRAAFTAAMAAGRGIELDVQMSADGVVFVFHDETLERLTNSKGAFAALNALQLGMLMLKGSDETIPTLAEVLKLVAGQVPLLIEIKADVGDVNALCRAVADDLAEYPDNAAIMSFNPQVGVWFARFAPQWVRGLVMTEDTIGWRARLAARLTYRLAKPDFMAYDVAYLSNPWLAKLRAKGVPILTWTVNTMGKAAQAEKFADQIIYEGL